MTCMVETMSDLYALPTPKVGTEILVENAEHCDGCGVYQLREYDCGEHGMMTDWCLIHPAA